MTKFLLLFSLLFLVGCSSETVTNNIAPIADAGQDQYINVGTTVYLDGSGSYDANGDPLKYQWTLLTKPLNSSAQLSSTTVAAPSFFVDLEGDYTFQLIVNDGELASEPDMVTVSTATYIEPSTGPQAANEVFTPSNVLKQQPMLVIRLEFDNQLFVSDETTWQQIHFGTQPGNLKHYYEEISHNQFEFVPVNDPGNVVDGITTIHFYTNHPDPDINSITFTDDLHPFLKQAIEAVSSGGFDFSTYDADNNNVITPDELIVTFIMAGGEDAYSGNLSANGVWAHQWCTDPVYTPSVNGVTVMGCSGGGNYAIFGERHYDTLPNGTITTSHDATVGIIAHELGHSAFSLPDLYDTDSVYGGVSYYGLMGNGSWGQDGSTGQPGDTPTHMTAWSKIDVGWYSATATTADIYADVPVNASGTDTYNIIKTPVSGSSDEYFLVENRGVNGYDAGLKHLNDAFAGGLAIWHIDEQTIRDGLYSNTVNIDATHKGVDLEEANAPSVDDSLGDPVENLYYLGNKTEFTPNTVPNTNLYDNSRSYIFFTDISSNAGTMTVRINNPL